MRLGFAQAMYLGSFNKFIASVNNMYLYCMCLTILIKHHRSIYSIHLAFLLFLHLGLKSHSQLDLSAPPTVRPVLQEI